MVSLHSGLSPTPLWVSHFFSNSLALCCRCSWLLSAFQKRCCLCISATRWVTHGPQQPMCDLLWCLFLWCLHVWRVGVDTNTICLRLVFVHFALPCVVTPRHRSCPSSHDASPLLLRLESPWAALEASLSLSCYWHIRQTLGEAPVLLQRGADPSTGCPAFDVPDTISL